MQGVICYTELFAFGANPEEPKKLFTEMRVRGYAEALKGNFVKKVRIFCPPNEYGPMRDRMVELGAPIQRIEFEKTLATTYHNARVMRTLLGQLDLKSHEVCLSSSVYHGRAAFFGQQQHDLKIVFVPAEAFIFANAPAQARPKLLDELCQYFGDSQLTRLIIDDAKGIGTRIAGEYVIPPQPTEQ